MKKSLIFIAILALATALFAETETATPKTICTDSEIFNECVSYETTFTNTCFEPVTEEEIEAILDTPINGSGREGGMAEDIANCCKYETMRNIYKTRFECVKAAETCENKECCETCEVQLAYDNPDEGDGDAAADTNEEIDPANTDAGNNSNTEAPTTDATPEDTANGDSATPATDSEAPAENKEESKSDGCSMLFV